MKTLNFSQNYDKSLLQFFGGFFVNLFCFSSFMQTIDWLKYVLHLYSSQLVINYIWLRKKETFKEQQLNRNCKKHLSEGGMM